MKKYIIGNWKANPVRIEEAERLAQAVENGTRRFKNVEVVVCPPFVFLEEVREEIKKVKLGAQDVFWENAGPFTGQVTPQMLKRLGVRYALLGHSERRKFGGDTDAVVNRKLHAAIRTGLTPVLCLGGGLQQSDSFTTIKSTVLRQGQAGLRGVRRGAKLVLVYEPTWAISKGKARHKSATPEHAEEMAVLIRKLLSGILGRASAKKIPVLYGGSANAVNAKAFLSQPHIDGLLPGAASLKRAEFIRMVVLASGS